MHSLFIVYESSKNLPQYYSLNSLIRKKTRSDLSFRKFLGFLSLWDCHCYGIAYCCWGTAYCCCGIAYCCCGVANCCCDIADCWGIAYCAQDLLTISRFTTLTGCSPFAIKHQETAYHLVYTAYCSSLVFMILSMLSLSWKFSQQWLSLTKCLSVF